MLAGKVYRGFIEFSLLYDDRVDIVNKRKSFTRYSFSLYLSRLILDNKRCKVV